MVPQATREARALFTAPVFRGFRVVALENEPCLLAKPTGAIRQLFVDPLSVFRAGFRCTVRHLKNIEGYFEALQTRQLFIDYICKSTVRPNRWRV